MSRPRLHEKLKELFEKRSHELLGDCLAHSQFKEFMDSESLSIPMADFVKAFTHTSFSHEYQVPHQELLEFLGDSVLQLIITDRICTQYPEEKEGKLSKLRSSVVNEKTLATLALSLKLDELILVGKGEYKKELYLQEAVLGDTMEALICQIYRHQGYEATKNKFLGWLQSYLPEALSLSVLDDFDAKSKLQEATLGQYKILPRYTGDASGEGFLVKLWLGEKMLAEGVFSSKKIGERELAQKVLKNKSY